MSSLNQELTRRLEALEGQGLRRVLRRVDSAPGRRIEIGGRALLNFSSNDYLGLASHPALRETAARAAARWGAGAGSSRLICGSLAPQHELEEALAEFKGTEAALTFSSGYATALGTITALLSRPDVVILDKLAHACLVDAARLSGAKLRVFKHNDLTDVEALLRWAAGIRPRHVLVVTESVFSMDGDHAPLRELVELKDRFGAWLMVDEAHATGLYGARRRGLAEALEVAERVDIQMGTLGKALGAAGGYIAGSRALVDYLVNRARSFMFSTAPTPAAAAAATAAVRLVAGAEGAQRGSALWARVAQWRGEMAGRGGGRHAGPAVAEPAGTEHALPVSLLRSARPLTPALSPDRGEDTPKIDSRCEPPHRLPGGAPASSPALVARGSKAAEDGGAPVQGEGVAHSVVGESGGAPRAGAGGFASAIQPLLVGDEREAVAVSETLRARGIFVPAIRYPSVARGKARLRVTLSAAHSSEDVAAFAKAWRAGFHPSIPLLESPPHA